MDPLKKVYPEYSDNLLQPCANLSSILHKYINNTGLRRNPCTDSKGSAHPHRCFLCSGFRRSLAAVSQAPLWSLRAPVAELQWDNLFLCVLCNLSPQLCSNFILTACGCKPQKLKTPVTSVKEEKDTWKSILSTHTCSWTDWSRFARLLKQIYGTGRWRIKTDWLDFCLSFQDQQLPYTAQG